MIDIKELPVMPTILELGDLFEQHWDEVYNGDNPFPPKPDYEMYQQIQDVGMTFGLFAYYGDVIVGYSVNHIMPNLHSRGFFTCNNDVLYVDPLFRDSPLGLKLMKQTEKKGKEKGASLMVWNAPFNTNLVKILPRLGYKPLEVVMCKEI